ncbi:tripartite ATP-independent transporter DctM subunit [Bradyrhizobium sp. F1.13.1]
MIEQTMPATRAFSVRRMVVRASCALLAVERIALMGLMYLLTALILVNVVTRYSHFPIYWIDESAVYCVVWLTFVGASAMTRLRLDFAVTMLTERLSPRAQKIAKVISTGLVVVFGLALIVTCALWMDPIGLARAGFDGRKLAAETFNFLYTEHTQTLNWPDLGALSDAAYFRGLDDRAWSRQFAGRSRTGPAHATEGLCALRARRGQLMITSAAFLAIMLVGVPIGLSLCLAGLVYIAASGNPVLFQSYPLQLFGGVDSYGLIAIPLFILIGEIMNGGGITRRIVDMAMAFVGSLKGGLAYVNILANMFISSILGSATAQVAIMAQIMVPEMEKKGYDKTFAAGLTAYGGMLGPIIPPSVMFVVYSVLAQVSVSDMLIAGIVPGVILTVMFCVVIALMGYVYNYPRADYQTPRQRVATILRTSPTLLIPIVIVGTILGGLANATESAAVGVVAAALVGKFWTREFEFSQLPQMMLRSAIYSAIVLFLVAAAAVFSWVLIFGKVPQETAAWIQTAAKDPISFMLICNVILLVIGTVIDGIPGLIMTVPILLPVATDVYHIDPRHFGVVVVINLVLGLLSPPVGLCFFVAAAVTGAKPGKMFMVTLPFFVISCVLLVLLSLYPSLSLILIK